MLLLLLPISLAKVGIYSKDFSIDCYTYTDAVRSLRPEPIGVLVSYLRDLGFDVEAFQDAAAAFNYDGVIVPSCTTLEPEDINTFISYYRSGGGLLIDVRQDSPLAEAFGVARKSEMVEGVNTRSFKSVYTEVVNGVYISGAITDPNGPVKTGYEHIFYIGKALKLPESFNSSFATPDGKDVLGWKKGEGRVIVTGCLYCSGPLLLAEMVDWIEDGYIDFPDFVIQRRVIPQMTSPGGLLSDEITILSSDIKVRGEYAYNVGGSRYCNFELVKADIGNPEPMGDKYAFSARFTLKAGDETGACRLPPVLLHLEYDDQRRDVIVDPVKVEVVKGTSPWVEKTGDSLPWIGLSVVVLALIVFLFAKKRSERSRLLNEWRKLKRIIKTARIKRMKGELSEEAYKKLIAEYEARLQEIEAEMEMKGIPIPSVEGGKRGGEQPQHRRQPTGSGRKAPKR